jgi:MFS family permease
MQTTVKKSGFDILYIVSFVEGSALMAIELLGAKMIAPYYGNSLYVWTAVLATTLGGLALGYFFGGVISEKYPTRKALYTVIAISAAVVGFLPILGPWIMNATLNMELRTGITLSSFVMLTPPLLCFGMVSPMIINLLSTDVSLVGKYAGTIYAVSTFGGILATFLMGFYMIPYVGIRMSTFITAIALGIWPVIYFIGAAKKSA